MVDWASYDNEELGREEDGLCDCSTGLDEAPDGETEGVLKLKLALEDGRTELELISG